MQSEDLLYSLPGIIIKPAIVLIVITLNLVACINPGEASRKPSLLDLASKHNVLIGAITTDNFWNLSDTQAYQEIYKQEFNIVTPENQMKFAYLQPKKGVFEFGAADRHLQFAEQNRLALHGHALLWHLFNPDWLNQGPRKRQDMIKVMYQHIDRVMGRYKGRVLIWDVINEPIEWNGTLRSSIWRDRIGEDYMELALHRARRADPGAKIIINDYDIATLNAKSDGLYHLTKHLLSKGVPLDGIGFQMHLVLDQGFDGVSFSENLQRFADLGIKLYITELDIAIKKDVTQQDLQKQANLYRDIFSRALQQSAVKAIQMWGFTDKYSWIDYYRSGHCCGLLFNQNFEPKPAHTAVMDILLSGLQPVTSTVTLVATANHGAQGVDASTSIIYNVDDQDWIKFDHIDLKQGFGTLRVRYANGQAQLSTHRVEVRLDSPTGPLIATLPTSSTGSWNTFIEETTSVTGGLRSHTIYMVFKGGYGVGNFEWFRFEDPRPRQPDKLRVESVK